MIGNQDVAVVNRDIPLNGVPLQIAKAAMRNPRAVHLVMKSLAENGVVGVGNGDVIDNEITHHLRFLTTNENLRDGAKAAHRHAFNHTVRPANIQRHIVQTAALLPTT